MSKTEIINAPRTDVAYFMAAYNIDRPDVLSTLTSGIYTRYASAPDSIRLLGLPLLMIPLPGDGATINLLHLTLFNALLGVLSVISVLMPGSYATGRWVALIACTLMAFEPHIDQ